MEFRVDKQEIKKERLHAIDDDVDLCIQKFHDLPYTEDAAATATNSVFL